ncbi:MAG: hypothetical protein JWO38_4966 [Gemmataceae bacterium]|nr:hypothetical protein [Gemmataceae bacterium]
MKCLAVQQPWAWAICAGFKRVENRSWKTPYRGPIAIVASGKRAQANRAVKEFTGGRVPADVLAYSAIIGTAVLSDVVPLSEVVEGDPHAFGPYCWLMEQPRLFHKPIPTKAKLRLYDPTSQEIEQIAQEAARPWELLPDAVCAAFARSLETDLYQRCVSQANHYWRQDQWPDLERATARLLSLDPKQPDGYFFRAELAFSAERDEEALADFTRAIELDPEWVLAYLGRSDLHKAMGNTAAAEADYARAIELDPDLANQDNEPQEDEE